MKNFFQNIGVWNIVETGYTEPIEGKELSSDAVKELEKNRQLDCKAMYYLNTQVQLHVAKKFIHAKSAKEAWTILVNSNRGAANVRKIRLQELRRQFELAQMKSTESVKDFIGTIKEIVNDMESNGENLEEVRVVEKVLRSLTTKFHTKKTVLEATKDLDNLSLDELEGELLTYEISLNQQTSDTVEEVLQAKVDHPKGKEGVNRMDTNQRGQNFRGRERGGKGNFRGRGRGNYSYQPRNNFNGDQENSQQQSQRNNFQRRDRSNVQCYNCGKIGHYQSECWSNEEVYAKVAENSCDREETLLFSSSTSEESMKNDWFIDSGCRNHMCGKKEMFSDLDESFHASVRFGNNEKVPVLGKGKIRIILQDGSSNYISDVFYVPSL
ncbi:uncharacterized protein [Coffea arabica]|uniref:CCHC-type domain-containing protein n=1 Tax=Coffea arabica TaxID=13443 RepID=A0ABM4UKL0_COFAR